VTAWRVDTTALTFSGPEGEWPCSMGRSGACLAADKREGDGCTPLGIWPFRGALIRPDRGFAAPAYLPWRLLRSSDGWSDGAGDPAYNRPVIHPHRWSAERLWRDDGCYDAILILGHNDSPPEPGAGSAIFLHLQGVGATEGCIAVGPEAMQHLLARIAPGDVLDIR
jgi:L,D-peptidoglycan transpeptidase YkuD (ErfK/YbiS/YcfS/YnhG family)